MSAARAVIAALVLVGVASPMAARAGPRTLVVYPVATAGSAAADAADVAALLDPALRRVVQRAEDVALAEPLFLRGSCGAGAAAAPACLAGLSRGGLVLRVTVHRSQSLLLVQLEAVDAKARAFGPVTVSIDAYAQSAEPLVRGTLVLLEQVAAATRKPDLRAGAVPLPPPPALAGPAARSPAAAPAPPPAAEPARPGGWAGAAGPWLTGAGAALLASGVALSVANHSLARELDRKFAAGTLGPADLDAYRRVERNDRLTRVLLGAGGAFTLAGVALWTYAPLRGGAAAGVSGRF